ncbi:MAG: hypothetical protein HYY93_14190 [Planctomycetes bacterium]|nr:hypothetical protein [Planctomycetota bacterium]
MDPDSVRAGRKAVLEGKYRALLDYMAAHRVLEFFEAARRINRQDWLHWKNAQYPREFPGLVRLVWALAREVWRDGESFLAWIEVLRKERDPLHRALGALFCGNELCDYTHIDPSLPVPTEADGPYLMAFFDANLQNRLLQEGRSEEDLQVRRLIAHAVTLQNQRLWHPPGSKPEDVLPLKEPGVRSLLEWQEQESDLFTVGGLCVTLNLYHREFPWLRDSFVAQVRDERLPDERRRHALAGLRNARITDPGMADLAESIAASTNEVLRANLFTMFPYAENRTLSHPEGRRLYEAAKRVLLSPLSSDADNDKFFTRRGAAQMVAEFGHAESPDLLQGYLRTESIPIVYRVGAIQNLTSSLAWDRTADGLRAQRLGQMLLDGIGRDASLPSDLRVAAFEAAASSLIAVGMESPSLALAEVYRLRGAMTSDADPAVRACWDRLWSRAQQALGSSSVSAPPH